jgi:hypothetical protein
MFCRRYHPKSIYVVIGYCNTKVFIATVKKLYSVGPWRQDMDKKAEEKVMKSERKNFLLYF